MCSGMNAYIVHEGDLRLITTTTPNAGDHLATVGNYHAAIPDLFKVDARHDACYTDTLIS